MRFILDGASVGARGGLSETEGSVLPAGDPRQVLGLLLGVAEQQDALEADGLVRTERDAHAQVVRAHHLHEARVLRVGQPESAEIRRHLQTERSQVPQPRYCVVFNFRICVVLCGIIYLQTKIIFI